ncbi:BAG4 regulator, partial [Polypterus senegalus]
MSRMQTPNHVAYGVAVNDAGAVMSGGDPSWEMQHQQHLNPKVNWAHYNNSDHSSWPAPVVTGNQAPQYSGSTYLPYGNGMTGVSQNPPYQNPPPSHPRTPVETWSHAPGGYGPPQNQWQTVPQAPPVAYGNPFLPPQSNSWLQAAPTAPPYEPKDPPYSTFPPDSQPSHPVVSNPRPLNLSTGQASEYSSPPQLYNKPGKNQKAQGEHQQNERDSLPPHFQKSDNPGVAQIQQVLQRVFHLEESVDEFVGYKTDKSYRCLEELLTKELLQLDSVETNGQELVRQVRKEAVQKVQGILDRLEKKAF